MNSKITIKIKKKETGDIVFQENFDNYKQFRILYFDNNGFAHTYGKAPWKLIKTPLKEFARNWANTHAEKLETMVKQCLPDATDEVIKSILHDLEIETVKVSVAEGDKRDMAIASNMASELLQAAIKKLRTVLRRITTIWEFPQPNTNKNDNDSILGWLFRGGGNNGYNN